MRVVVGCERSGVVCAAFVNAGHDAYSCDLEPAEAAHPYPHRHLQCDVMDVLQPGAFDLGILHPDCTYLCASGLHWNKRVPGRAEKTEAALAFVLQLDARARAVLPRYTIENPRGCIGTRMRPSSQSIQPYQHGHDASKETFLWSHNLPLIEPTAHVAPRAVCPRCKAVGRGDLAALMFAGGCHVCGNEAARIRPRWANQTDSGQNALPPSANRWMDRSRTYAGIAAAMVRFWGNLPPL